MRKVIVLGEDEPVALTIRKLNTGWINSEIIMTKQDDITEFIPFEVVLFVGRCCVSYLRQTKGARVVEIPSLTNVRWNERRLAFVSRIIREGTEDVEIRLDKRTGQVIAESLVPF